MNQSLLSPVTPADGPQPEAAAPASLVRRGADFQGELQAAGAGVFAGGLDAPDHGTVVRTEDNHVLMTGGPFAGGREYGGGMCSVKPPDVATAVEWGRKAPAAVTPPIDVRPPAGGSDGAGGHHGSAVRRSGQGADSAQSTAAGRAGPGSRYGRGRHPAARARRTSLVPGADGRDGRLRGAVAPAHAGDGVGAWKGVPV